MFDKEYCARIKHNKDTMFQVAMDLQKNLERTEEEQKALVAFRELKRRLCTKLTFAFILIGATAFIGTVYKNSAIFVLTIPEIIYVCMDMMQTFEDAHDFFAKEWYVYYRAQKEKVDMSKMPKLDD